MNKDFVEAICDAGGDIYLVGGSVRNKVYNIMFNSKIAIKDYDLLCRNLSIDNLASCLEKHGVVKEVGKSFGVIKFHTHEMKDMVFDIALPRTEISTGNSHIDFDIIIDPQISIEDDFKRRDCTINAMAIQIHNVAQIFDENIILSNVIDPHNGCDDLRNRLWRAIGDPYERFNEDSIRIMRAMRQCAELDLQIEENTKECIMEHYSILKNQMNNSICRITDELVKIIIHNEHPIIDFIFSSGIATLLEIPITGCFIIKKCPITCNIRVKMACLLSAHDNEYAGQWCKKFVLSTTQKYSKNDIGFIDIVAESYKLIAHIIQNDTDDKQRIIMIRRLMQYVERNCYGRGVDYTKDLLILYSIISNNNINELLSIYENEINNPDNKNFILHENDLEIDGFTIMNRYELYGINIKTLKQKLFNLVTENYVINTMDALISYIDKIIMNPVQ